MTATKRPDTLARQRANELIRAWDGRSRSIGDPLGSLLGRVSTVDQVGVEERVDALKRRSIALRATIGRAEELFTVLRSLHRPVRLMRVPENAHELNRSGTPFRRVENPRIGWLGHFLVDGKRVLPPLPKVRSEH